MNGQLYFRHYETPFQNISVQWVHAKLCEPSVGVVSTPYYSGNDLRLDGILSN